MCIKILLSIWKDFNLEQSSNPRSAGQCLIHQATGAPMIWVFTAFSIVLQAKVGIELEVRMMEKFLSLATYSIHSNFSLNSEQGEV